MAVTVVLSEGSGLIAGSVATTDVAVVVVVVVVIEDDAASAVDVAATDVTDVVAALVATRGDEIDGDGGRDVPCSDEINDKDVGALVVAVIVAGGFMPGGPNING